MRVLLLISVLAVGWPGSAVAARTKPTPCADGRFRVVQGGQLEGGSGPVTALAVVLQGGRFTLPGVCDAPAGKAKGKKTATLARAKWPQCGELRKVKLAAKIASPACDVLEGKLSAKKQKAAAIRALRSYCGDGTIDSGNDEECEGTTGCGAGAHCVATSCLCEADPTTTSVTVVSTSSSSSTSTSSSTVPVAICGDGTVQAAEPCDPLATPSGCGAGDQCNLQDGVCSCGPIPAEIGNQVSFTPPPPPDLVALGVPAYDLRSYHLSANGDGDLLLDAEVKDPLTALGRCTGWIAACVAPPERSLDDCARSAPACATAEPWLEANACCPAACFTAYEALRRDGSAPLRALRAAYFEDGSCIPGLRDLLGTP